VTPDDHPHLADPCPPGWVRVDFHSHTMWSGDCTTTPEEVEEAVRSSGIDVLCITDHNTVNGARELFDRLPCRVIIGEEVRTHAGEIIGLFLKDRLVPGQRSEHIAHSIREQGGLVYVPHPFDPDRSCLKEDTMRGLAVAGLLDGIEVMNAKVADDALNARALAFAREFDLPGGAGSDAHVPEAIGAAYLEMPDFDGPASFLESMHRARVVGHHFDAARRWRPRIVPSTQAI
jgi:predicted metal-dependent phosphoesterase TrpH